MLLRPSEMADVGRHLMRPVGCRRDQPIAGGETGKWAVLVSPRRKTMTIPITFLFHDVRKGDATRTLCPRAAWETLVDALGPSEETNRMLAETIVGPEAVAKGREPRRPH